MCSAAMGVDIEPEGAVVTDGRGEGMLPGEGGI